VAVRLWVTDNLAEGARAALSAEQVHYLSNVMRLRAGDEVLAFNGRDGEWRARLEPTGKRSASLAIVEQTRIQASGPDLDLVAALVKRARLETIVEKAAELGARRVQLAITERTNADHANVARLSAIAVEASEQTGRLDAPEVLAPVKLARLLESWPADRALMFCDEAGEAPPALEALLAQGAAASPWAILIGPEGGFSPRERELIRAHPVAVAVSLGPRILRADTAAISALTLWQAARGDLKGA
jgi:16S rRNA (uracil1498-N3)-methyltransferase